MAFTPIPGQTYLLSVPNGSAAAVTNLPSTRCKVRLAIVSATTPVYISIGGTAAKGTPGTGAVTPGDMPLSGGAGSLPVFLDKGPATSISALGDGAVAVLAITLGDGDGLG